MPTSGFDGWVEADRLAWSGDGQEVLAQARPDTRIADLINAAWAARIARPHQESTLADVAMTQCEDIIARRIA
jgi:hypothetical protein